MTLRTLAVHLAALAVCATPALADIPSDGEGISGVYAGSYLCEDGEHGVVLDIAVSPRENGNGLRIDGTLGFVPVLAGSGGDFATVVGSFSILGLLGADGRIQINAGDWIVQPEGYGAANLRGQLSQRPDGIWQITGRPLAGQDASGQERCSDLIATRVLPS